MTDNENNLGKILKHRRVTVPLTLQELGAMSGVSTTHLGRIERGERFPSARTLQRIAKPLGFEEEELFTLAGYLSPHVLSVAEGYQHYRDGALDPYVAAVLSQEPVETQRALLAILSIMKSITNR
jgi:transcriptional regulator with XRE-family HTH domain